MEHNNNPNQASNKEALGDNNTGGVASAVNATTGTQSVSNQLEAPKMLDLLKEGWQFARERKDIVGWYVILLVAISVTSSEWVLEMNNIYSFVAGITSFVLMIFILINSWGIIYTASQPDSSSVSYKQAFDWSAKHFFPLLWTSILSGLATLFGFILLVIPGIAVLIYFYFSLYAVAMGTKYGTSALKQSYCDIKGRWWQVFGKLLTLGFWLFLAYILIGIVFGVAFATATDNVIANLAFEASLSGAGGVVGVMSIYALAQYYKYLRLHPVQQPGQSIDKKSST